MLKRLIDFLAPPIASVEVETLYRTCVAQARLPLFYERLQVPDSVDGRFDLLILHVLLIIDRLRSHPVQTQQLFDILFADMDKNLREMGVSDMSIAKKMKPMLAAFYGRAKMYEEALGLDDAALGHTLKRNIYGKMPPAPESILELTRYVRRAHRALKQTSEEALLKGHLTFASLEEAVSS